MSFIKFTIPVLLFTCSSSFALVIDSDNDGHADSTDNCPELANVKQWDKDMDGIGNECDNDIDGDGVSNDDEVAAGTKPWDERSFSGQSLADDRDQDGLVDSSDNCPEHANSGQWDLDHDGLGNDCDLDIDGDGVSNEDEIAAGTKPWNDKSFPGRSVVDDRDQDGFANDFDNCPDHFNQGQWDKDKDGLGNECDDDIDGDEVRNADEVSAGTRVWDPSSFPVAPSEADRDGDGINNEQDNCADIANGGQWDKDTDGLGNECDDDVDGDGFTNEEEIASGTEVWNKNSFPVVRDEDNDGIADAQDLCLATTENVEVDEFGCEVNIDLRLYDNSPLEDIALSSDWQCSSFVYQNDVWVRTFKNGGEQFDFRIGPGGVISELRDPQDGYSALLSPSYKGEPTDRVIQWTWWSNSLTNQNPQLPDYEWRFNVTQAGTFESIISPSFRLEMKTQGCQIDVYSEPQDQWKWQQSILSGRFTARTRYQIAKDGAIIVRRSLLVGESYFNGNPSPLSNEYLEAWTPFSRQKLDAVAYSLDENGGLFEWYRAGYNLPSYPFIDVTTTSGYAVAINSDSPTQSVAVGLVYGKKAPCYHQDSNCLKQGAYDLNLMEWDSGVGILPGLSLPDIRPGDLVDQYIVLQPSHGTNAELYQNLNYWADKIPAPRIIRAGAQVGEGFTDMFTTLKGLQGQQGSRITNLAPIAVDHK